VFGNVSGAAGLVFTPNEEYAISLSVSHSERAPTYQELFANGPHVATNAFEIGDPDLQVEQALGVDFSLRKRIGFVTGAVSAYVNQFDNFIGQFATGGFGSLEGEILPAYAYRATEARFVGGEWETTFHLLTEVSEPGAGSADARGMDAFRSLLSGQEVARPRLDLELKADYVRATDLTSGMPLPRISPFHARAALDYQLGDFGARLESIFAGEQDRVAANELPTDGYALVNASVSRTFWTGATSTALYVKGVNLTNEEAREHTSFLKDLAPLPGRGIVVGARISF
jgi:iron complex outermembrane receptor protein